MEKSKKLNRGITLIALIITIIILLILATVTVDIAVDGKLFIVAQDAVDKTNEKVDNTQNRIDELIGMLPERTPEIGDYVHYEPISATCEVTAEESGHTELQTFSTQTGEDSLKWRIMSLGDEDGHILLVADRPTTDELTLYGMVAFANGPGVIDELCATLYNNETLGTTARSYNFYNQVMTMTGSGTEDFIRETPKDGDSFPYLIEQEFWIPVSYYGWTTTADDLYICTENGKFITGVYLGDGYELHYGDTLPVLPVVILPDVNLVYDSENSTDSKVYWHIEEK